MISNRMLSRLALAGVAVVLVGSAALAGNGSLKRTGITSGKTISQEQSGATTSALLPFAPGGFTSGHSGDKIEGNFSYGKGFTSRALSRGELRNSSAAKSSAPAKQKQDQVTTADSETYATEISGAFVQGAGACEPPDPDDVNHFKCTATAVATGDWIGTWVEHLDFRRDPTTGNFAGTADQCFQGTYVKDNTSGTLHVFEDVTLDGLTFALRGTATILGGTGDWVGSSGTYSAYGTVPGVGIGGYYANWLRPLPKRSPSTLPDWQSANCV